MNLELAIQLFCIALTLFAIVVSIYDAPGLLSLIGLKKAANWSERQINKLPKLPFRRE